MLDLALNTQRLIFHDLFNNSTGPICCLKYGYNNKDLLMGSRLDLYSSQAEALPVFLAIAPIALLLTMVLPGEISLKGLPIKSLPFVGVAGLSFVFSQIGADSGKRLEKRLWERWGGPPTTRFLRHGNQEYNEITRRHVHESLQRLGMHMPTSDEQLRDLAHADQCYEAGTKELRRLTRDKTRFPLVHKRLVDYGFRRNILGLKRLGLLIAVAAFLLCLWHIVYTWDMSTPDVFMVTVCSITAISVVAWLALVNEKTVRRGANRYADSLLEAARSLE